MRRHESAVRHFEFEVGRHSTPAKLLACKQHPVFLLHPHEPCLILLLLPMEEKKSAARGLHFRFPRFGDKRDGAKERGAG